jgi:hypothetical protein
VECAGLNGHGRVGVHVHGEGGEVKVHEVGVFAFVGAIGTVEVGWPEVGELGLVGWASNKSSIEESPLALLLC